MKLNDIHDIIVKEFPLKRQEKWDNSGIFYKTGSNPEITGILFCLDLSKETIKYALNNGINLIVSHHPLGLKDQKTNKYDQELSKMLKTSKMNFASYHTNVDNSPTGINYYIAKEMGLHQIKVIPNTSIVTGKLGFSYRAKVFANTLRVQFDLERILYTSDDLVRNVAFCAGAGFEILKENQNKLNGVDLWVTGDIKWHQWEYAKNHEINVMDVGHDLENTFLELLTKLITANIKLIKVQSFPNKQGIKIVI